MRGAFLVILILFMAVRFASAQESKITANDTNHLIEFIDGRMQKLVHIPGPCSIPFLYPDRPTLDVRLSGQSYQFLLDSGTRLSILKLSGNNYKPNGLHYTGSDSMLADLDGGRALEYSDHFLRYAQASLLSCGDLRIRNLPLRTYIFPDGIPDSDYDGSLALQALRELVVEIDNDSLMINLHQSDEFRPSGRSMAIPVLSLHDMLLVRARTGEGNLLLMLDTGFSGELLINSAAAGRIDSALTFTGGTSGKFSGFHGEISGRECLLDQLVLDSQSWPGLASQPVEQGLITALVLDSELEQTALGQLDGILGAGFLSRFNYAIDMSRGVLFLQLR